HLSVYRTERDHTATSPTVSVPVRHLTPSYGRTGNTLLMIAGCLLAFACLLIFYILLGYPLLLASGILRSAPAVRKDLSYQPSVTIVLAVHDGESFIARKLDSILALDYPKDLIQILVVSDESTDQTDAIVLSYGSEVTLIRIPRGGKSAALNLALQHSRGEIL